MDILKIIREEIEYEKMVLGRIASDEYCDAVLYTIKRLKRNSKELR